MFRSAKNSTRGSGAIKEKSKAVEVGSSIAKGAFASTTVAFGFLPLTQVVIAKQTYAASQRPLEIAYKIFTREGLKRAYSVSSTFLVWTPLRSAAYLGVANAVSEQMGEQKGVAKQLRKGVIAGCASAFFESAVDAWGLRRVVSTWNPVAGRAPINPATVFLHCYSASLTKNMWANSWTLVATFGVKSALDEYSILPPFIRPAVAGFAGPVMVGLVVAPFVYLETNTANDPSRNMLQHLKQVSETKAWNKLWHGAGTRMVQRGLSGAGSWGLLYALNNYLKMPEVTPPNSKPTEHVPRREMGRV